VKATEAERVFVTHGFKSAFSRFLNEEGIEAAEIQTEFVGEEEEESSQADDVKDETIPHGEPE
jgi:putative mRNA 3-end processing factor